MYYHLVLKYPVVSSSEYVKFYNLFSATVLKVRPMGGTQRTISNFSAQLAWDRDDRPLGRYFLTGQIKKPEDIEGYISTIACKLSSMGLQKRATSVGTSPVFRRHVTQVLCASLLGCPRSGEGAVP